MINKPYGCLMLHFKVDKWPVLMQQLKEEDLYYGTGETDAEFARELDPHCTLLYGFHHDEINTRELRKHALPLKNIVVRLKNLSIFQNELFDVLKFAIESSDLNNMNSTYKSNFAYTSTFPTYNPHMTIAYLQPGKGVEYVNNIGNRLKCNIENGVAHFSKPYVIKPHKYSYSYNFRERETFIK